MRSNEAETWEEFKASYVEGFEHLKPEERELAWFFLWEAWEYGIQASELAVQKRIDVRKSEERDRESSGERRQTVWLQRILKKIGLG